MLQIVFNEISAAEISQLPTLQQLSVLDQFQVTQDDLKAAEETPSESAPFGQIKRDGKELYRYRADDVRIYFEVSGDSVIVHRVLHKGTMQDFRFRASLPMGDEEALHKSPQFWKLIEEGENARRI